MSVLRDSSAETGFNVTNFNYTCTGSNVGLLLAIQTNAPSSIPSGVTYNGVALTLILSINDGAGATLSFWYLLNAPTGSNTVVITGGSNPTTIALSYTGVLAMGPSHSSLSGSVTTWSDSVTTDQDNEWLVMAVTWAANGVGTLGAGASTSIVRQSTVQRLAVVDSNGAKTPVGTYSLNVTQSPADIISDIIIAISPTLSTTYFDSMNDNNVSKKKSSSSFVM